MPPASSSFTPNATFSGNTAIGFRVEENPISGYNYSTTITVGGFQHAAVGYRRCRARQRYRTSLHRDRGGRPERQASPTAMAAPCRWMNLSANHRHGGQDLDEFGHVVSYTITPDTNYNGVVNLATTSSTGQGGVIAATQRPALAAADDR